MEKVYIQVQELVTAYNAPINEIMGRVKAGTLALYERKCLDYIIIDSFDRYIDSYIAKERDRIEKRYIREITNIQFPSEMTLRAREILNSLGNRWKRQRRVRQIGVDEIIYERRDRAIKILGDRELVAKRLAFYLFVKPSEYESIANNLNKPTNGGRRKDEYRTNKTNETCQSVEKLYGQTLVKKSKRDVFNLVKAEMGGDDPHIETFNAWYHDCPHTRTAGNPRKTRKPA